jgi:hypothetical protein
MFIQKLPQPKNNCMCLAARRWRETTPHPSSRARQNVVAGHQCRLLHRPQPRCWQTVLASASRLSQHARGRGWRKRGGRARSGWQQRRGDSWRARARRPHRIARAPSGRARQAQARAASSPSPNTMVSRAWLRRKGPRSGLSSESSTLVGKPAGEGVCSERCGSPEDLLLKWFLLLLLHRPCVVLLPRGWPERPALVALLLEGLKRHEHVVDVELHLLLQSSPSPPTHHAP